MSIFIYLKRENINIYKIEKKLYINIYYELFIFIGLFNIWIFYIINKCDKLRPNQIQYRVYKK